MSTINTRWNLVVSKQTDKSLRQFLANEGGGKKGDLSRFVEANEMDEIVEESLAWARARLRR
jgi:hypothetical protein